LPGRSISLPQINEAAVHFGDYVLTCWRRIFMKSPDQAAFKAILIITVVIAILALPFVAKAESSPTHSPPSFSEFDKDGDGFVSEDEFNSTRAERHAEMAAAGKPMKGMASAPTFSDLDSDGDGQLNEAELTAGQKAHMKAMRAQHKGQGKGKGRPVFSDLDLDGDGCINAEEFDQHQAERHGKQQRKQQGQD
jgi:Ca2+-binding EF-hand superfamily protein